MSKSTNVQMQWNVRIPLRDGIHLSAILYLPANRERPAPTLFAMTPYTAQSHHNWGVYFAAHGYPFLNVDVRGRGNSQGEFQPRREANDAYDVVEWLSGQSYCNGNVAMYGASYLGYCQWAAASVRPPHLSTIVPVAPAFFGVDFPVRNDVFSSYAAQWLMLVAGNTSQDKMFADATFWRQKYRQWLESGVPFNQLDATIFGAVASLFQEWIAHPHRDEYWDSYNPTAEQCSQLSIPILTITGAYDADQPGALEHYRQHVKNASAEARARHYLVIGPWDHAGCSAPKAQFGGLRIDAAGVIDLQLLHQQWYAWTMQGAAKPEFLQENVAYYVTGAERWRYADSLEAVTARSQPLYLRSTGNPSDAFRGGTLAAEPPAVGEPDRYVYDPRDVSLAELESVLDSTSFVEQRLVHAMTGKQLVYHGAPFAQATEISGFFALTLWLAIDQPDTDFRAVVYEVALDGSVMQLSRDWLRARHRESSRSAKLIDTTEPLRYDFQRFMFVARRIPRGHRLRLVVGPINSIYWQKNYNGGGAVSKESVADARTVTVRLFHDAAHASVLRVPLGQLDDGEDDVRDPGDV